LETFYNAPHPDTASAHHNYGLTLVGMQQWDEAERQLRAALAMYESIFGVLSPQLTRCLTSLGEVLVDRQRYTQARPVLQRAIDLMEAQRWNPMLQAEAYWALGQAQSGMGNAKAAAKSQQRADYRGWLARQRERKRQV
jgi:tetratricopeptide (TPR) repeat protein